MAFCKVYHKNNLGKYTSGSPLYVCDRRKTAHLSGAVRQAHSIRGEEQQILPPGGFVTFIGVTDETSFLREVRDTWACYGKENEAHTIHMIQSFAPGDNVGPLLAHDIGMELLGEIAGGCEAIVATHLNRHHIHNHILFSSLRFSDGSDIPARNIHEVHVNAVSNRICRRWGIASFPVGKCKEKIKTYRKYDIKDTVRRDVTYAARQAGSLKAAIPMLELLGYARQAGRRGDLIRPPEGDYSIAPERLFPAKDTERLALPRARHTFRARGNLPPERRCPSSLVAKYVWYCGLLSLQTSFRPRSVPFGQYRERHRRLEELRHLLAGGMGSKEQLHGRRRRAQTDLARIPPLKGMGTRIRTMRRCLDTLTALHGLEDLSPAREKELAWARRFLRKKKLTAADAAVWLEKTQKEHEALHRQADALRREIRLCGRITGQLPVIDLVQRAVRQEKRRWHERRKAHGRHDAPGDRV